MAGKIIFSECCAPYWVNVALKLREESGLEPCYWIAREEFTPYIKKTFPDVVIHYGMDAIRGVPPKELPDFPLGILDKEIIDNLAVYESTVFSMLNRMDGGYTFDYQERVRFYHGQLRFWLGVLDYYKPEAVVFCTTPHITYDYILYILCKYKGIRTIMFRTAIEGMVYATEAFEDFPEKVISLYKTMLSRGQQKEVKLSAVLEKYWQRVSGPKAIATPYYIKDFIKAGQRSLLTKLKKRLASIPKYISFLYTKAPDNYLKLRNRSFEDRKMSYLEFLKVCKFDAEKKKKKLKACYDQIAENVSLDKPYIYVPLAYQPEASTAPDGGIFVNQLLMIDMLSKLVPAGWSIYVKEHPTQFSPMTVGERSRSFEFYQDIASLANVKIVSFSVSSFDLIDNSKVVANVTGSAGWETAIRGKPALIFGYAWYRGCEGTFYTPTIESIQQVLADIENGYKVDRQKVKLFVYALEKACLRGYIHTTYKPLAGISDQENAITLTRTIQNLLEKSNEVVSRI